jgi:hypothetical protein
MKTTTMSEEIKDFPLQDCAKQAETYIAQGGTIFQKWTCAHCGARQTMEQPNTLYTSGKCEECEKVTSIENCNYLLIL